MRNQEKNLCLETIVLAHLMSFSFCMNPLRDGLFKFILRFLFISVRSTSYFSKSCFSVGIEKLDWKAVETLFGGFQFRFWWAGNVHWERFSLNLSGYRLRTCSAFNVITAAGRIFLGQESQSEDRGEEEVDFPGDAKICRTQTRL